MLFDDRHFMQLALEQAHHAAEQGEVPVGAVVVLHQQVIASGYNQTRAKNRPTAHAEVLAIENACQALDNYRLTDCSLYVTLEPCLMCAGAIINARIARLVFSVLEPKTGAIASCHHALDNHNNTHRVDWCSGVLAEEFTQLLTGFFQEKRQDKKKRQ